MEKTAPRIDKETGVRADAALIPPTDDGDLIVVRRSELERYATCPAQARFVELKRVLDSSLIAATGQEVHEACSECVDEYVQSAGNLNTVELADILRGRLNRSRPDVQPDVIDAAYYAAWPFAKFLNEISPANILRYDGGTRTRSGQLAMRIPHLKCKPTSEIDLLIAGPSKEVLHEVDFKSGHRQWSATSVSKSFQFQKHALLVFINYPQINELEVSIWQTRASHPNKPVTFSRDDFNQFNMRVISAATEWYKHRNAPPEQCITWPSVDACSICPAAHLCPAIPRSDVESDPAAYVLSVWALDTKLAAMQKELANYVVRTGADIVTESGAAFGFGKPKAERKVSPVLYSIKGD